MSEDYEQPEVELTDEDIQNAAISHMVDTLRKGVEDLRTLDGFKLALAIGDSSSAVHTLLSALNDAVATIDKLSDIDSEQVNSLAVSIITIADSMTEPLIIWLSAKAILKSNR